MESSLRPSFAALPRLFVLTAAFVFLGFGLDATARAALGPVVIDQVKDIRPGPQDGDPLQGGDGAGLPGGADLDGVLIFDANSGSVVAEGGLAGQELWRSDGTEAGTYMLKDVAPGNNGVLAYSSAPNGFVEMNGEVYFNALASPLSGELWKTDGTEAGTVLVKDLDPLNFNSGDPTQMVNVDGTLFFLAQTPPNAGYELWKSDGTAPGTEMVRDLEADPNFDISNMQAIGDQLYFSFDNGVNGRELWTSDGSFFGTRIVKDINSGAGGSRTGRVLEYNGFLYFRADDGLGTDGLELWRSDGTPGGTELFQDLRPGSADGLEFGGPALVFGGELFINGDFGLFKTNGTPGDAELIIGGTGGFAQLTESDGALYFPVGSSDLYTSDGTVSGTELVPDGVFLPYSKAFGGSFYAAFDDGTHGTELWRSDLTASGTERLTDINPTGGSLINEMIVSGEYLYFRGTDGLPVGTGAGATGVELWAAHVDQTPPETSIDSGPPPVIGTSSATFTFSSDEPNSTFSCSIDGGAPTPCNAGTRTYGGLAIGSHSFSVAAVDEAPFSNADPTPATRNFTVVRDRTPVRLRLRARARQANPRLVSVVATCVNERCALRAAGWVRIKIPRSGRRAPTVRAFKLRAVRRAGPVGTPVRLKVRLNRRSQRLVRRVIRRRASLVTIRVRAIDRAGNVTTKARKVRLVRRR